MSRILPILLLASFLLADIKTVAISYFDNTSGLEEYNPLSKGLADMLITDLSNVKSIQIVEREKLESLLQEIDLGESKFMDPSTAQKLGKGLGAGSQSLCERVVPAISRSLRPSHNCHNS